MLSYAFNNLDRICEKGVNIEKFDNAQELLAVILYKGISYRLKKKLSQAYNTHIYPLKTPKGKLNLSMTIKQGLLAKHQIVCEYDELTENYLLNQILKSTCNVLITKGELKVEYKNLLKSLMASFQNIDLIDLKTIKWKSLVFHRNNDTYRLLINLCYIICNGMIMTTEDGSYKICNYINESQLYSLFQRFVLNYYKKHYPQLKPAASKIEWDIEDNEGIELLPNMRTDITLFNGNHSLIIDTKFYSKKILQSYYGKQSIDSSHLYQILAYVKNKDKYNTGNVSGLILYAKNENINKILLDKKIGKNRIQALTLDLNVKWEVIKQELNNIIEDHFSVTTR